MRIAVGSDHAGWEAKQGLVRLLECEGHQVCDVGTHTADPVDYPDYAHRVAEAVAGGACDRGVLLCGSGIGMSMAANRHRGVRAALCHGPEEARVSRAHNDANVLCLGARGRDAAFFEAIVRAWLSAPFEGERHAKRVAKIDLPGPRHPGAALLVLAGLLLLAPGSSAADRLVFHDGRVLEGRVREEADRYVIEVPGGVILDVPRSQVARREEAPAPQDVFTERLAALASADPASYGSLAEWATVCGMHREARAVWLSLLSGVPGSPEALDALGYENIDGIWMGPDDRHRLDGWLCLDGRWLEPGAYWEAYVAKLVRELGGDAAARARAALDLEAIRDARAEGALLAALRSSRIHVRVALLGGLASIGTDAAWDRIVRLALEDEEEALRDAARSRVQGGGDAVPAALQRRLETWYALDARGRARGRTEVEVRLRATVLAGCLEGFGGRRALYVLTLVDPASRVRHEAAALLARVPDERVFRGLVDALGSGHPMLQPRAAYALDTYGDARAIGPLIDALDRLLRDRAGGVLRPDSPFTLPAQMSAPAEVPLSLSVGADEQGNAGLSLLSAEVSALQRLSGKTFGEDVDRWRAWLSAQATPDEVDPR